ncbi:L,D-transpeptidase [Paractinoplanes toevensis]|uniref:L,D-TPase catalytic domain-containing protein n=1 Tax=Paractinoplanes toevensis TaxID=571911 RepID=A0A919TDA5_9ACTN|nr:L,D-transpeptidase [Actinoplanes toevensis]GIM93202.1 hypothetical protein Ato02nite_049950 [Actinoplanes toevensis]
MPSETPVRRPVEAILTGLARAGCGPLHALLTRLAGRTWASRTSARGPLGAYVDGAALPAARPASVLAAAPRDTNRLHGAAGLIAHPPVALAMFDQPGGRAFAQLRTTLAGGQAWLPVVAEQAGWIQILLPSQPAGSVGWVDASRVTLAHSRHEIRILVTARRVQLVFAGRITKSWPVTCGTPDTPTPPGRTFVLAVTRDPRRRPDPIVLPLAVASRHGGCGIDGVIAVHTGPPHAGCIIVPPAALPVLARAPLGSLVRIYP